METEAVEVKPVVSLLSNWKIWFPPFLLQNAVYIPYCLNMCNTACLNSCCILRYSLTAPDYS